MKSSTIILILSIYSLAMAAFYAIHKDLEFEILYGISSLYLLQITIAIKNKEE